MQRSEQDNGYGTRYTEQPVTPETLKESDGRITVNQNVNENTLGNERQPKKQAPSKIHPSRYNVLPSG